MRYISNHTSAREFIKARREFNGNSMSGRKRPTGDIGMLPGNWRGVHGGTYSSAIVTYKGRRYYVDGIYDANAHGRAFYVYLSYND